MLLVYILWSQLLVAFENSDRYLAAVVVTAGLMLRASWQALRGLAVLDQALAVAPGLADFPVAEWRVGLRPVAARGYPHLGAVPAQPGVFVATGAIFNF